MTRVLIASETEMVRRGLESLVAASSSLELAGSLAELSELGATVLEAAPDAVLVALDSSLEEFLQMTAAAIRGDGPPQPAFIVLAPDGMPYSALAPVRAGIRALLPLDATAEEILAAISAAVAGLIVLHPAMTSTDRDEAGPRPLPQEGPAPQLTGRELEILTMLAEGLGNKEIAWRLQISEHTVKFHISSIFTKLDVSSRAEAVSLGFRLGLILV